MGRWWQNPWWAALGIGALLLVWFYPNFLTFQAHPMGATNWELQDPVVSMMTFVPGHEVAQYELFENQQLLWSNLRGFGVPILGNDVQAAPMFPLTLLFMWVPESHFWNVVIPLRLLLMGAAAFLLARHCFRFRVLPSLIFVINFAYALYVVRWMNHPVQNGLLSGLWYLYFLSQMLQYAGRASFQQRCGWMLGVAISVYALVTCGFPESGVITALLALLTQAPLFVQKLWKEGWSWNRPYWFDAAISHLVGFALCSFQWLALVEIVSLTAPDFRSTKGLLQFGSFDLLLEMVTHFRQEIPHMPVVHVFGMITVFLAFSGLVAMVRYWRKISPWDVAAILTGGFYLLKSFPVSPAFNKAVGSLPLLDQTVFHIYGMPLLLWGVAYFAAKGARYYITEFNYQSSEAHWLQTLQIFVIAGMVLGLVVKGFGDFETAQTFWQNSARAQQLFLGFAGFLAILLIHTHLQLKYRVRWGARFVFTGLLVSILWHSSQIRPSAFYDFKAFSYNFVDSDPITEKAMALIEDQGRSLAEFRYWEPNGRHASEGLPTPDNGASAILPERLQRLRTGLFKTIWDGHMPMQGNLVLHANQLVSHNLYEERHLETFGLNPEQLQKWHTTPDGIGIYYDPQALPRAYEPMSCHVASTTQEALSGITQEAQPVLGHVWIEELSDSEKVLCRGLDQFQRPVPILEDGGSQLHLGEVQGPTIVVLNDTYYPGWGVRDINENTPLEIRPANVGFRAVVLPESRPYQLVFSYRPGWFSLALWATLFGVAGVFLLWRWNRFGPRSRAGRTS